jgi:epoxide hydrolase-like predicted phosphatase
VLFDFGGVFTTSPFAALRARGEETGHGFETMVTLVMGPYDEDTDHPWHRVERGEMALAEALGLIADQAARLGVSFDAARVGTFFGPSLVQETVVEHARRLHHDGYRTGLVTNNVREFRRYWEELVPLELFDVVIDSSEVGMRKPDPRIFGLALDRLGVLADRAVFVDDWPGNVAAAEALGMAGVLMGEDPSAALAELDRLLAG